ncbi:MAG: hypothetical protein NVS4B8_09890 [Herpetosiphon sp.]
MGLSFNGHPIALVQVVVWVVVAIICGGIAEAILGYTHIGLVSSVGIGLVGALIGTWVAGALHLPPLLEISLAGVQIELVWSVLTAVLLIILVGSLRYRRGYTERAPRRYRY